MGTRVIVLALCMAAVVARADEPGGDERARALYNHGRDAFEHDHFEEALRDFKAAYLISQRPELLFNMAKAQERLERPHDAAESLRAYLRVRPDDPERPDIEEHIRALEEKQRLTDAERPRPPTAAPLVSAPSAPPPPSRTPAYRRWWLWTLVGAVAVGAAVGIGVGVSRAEAQSFPAAAASDGTFRF